MLTGCTQKSELTSLQRQNAQLIAAKRRTSASISLPSSTNTSDLQAQLNSKAETISTLELEISTLQSKLSTQQSKTDEQDSRLNTLELDLAKAIHDKESVAQELADLKANLEKASERAAADGSARSSAETRIAQLEAELGSSKRATEEASKRASTQEKKVATLTTLHRESDARHQTKLAEMGKQERDAKELRARVAALSNENARLTDEAIRRKKLEAAGDSEGLDELEDEERLRLAGKVRELEEEVFELRRGVWREKRMQMQPGMEGISTQDPYAANTTFSDIDLNSATSPSARRTQQNHSSLTDYINSGLSAFRGESPQANRRQSIVAGRDRGQSLGLMSDDGFEFDEDAFRKAQEDEAGKRLERVKEVKRGLVQWKGWRIDIADLRGGWGGVFEA
jgi:myosin heavy subunit